MRTAYMKILNFVGGFLKNCEMEDPWPEQMEQHLMMLDRVITMLYKKLTDRRKCKISLPGTCGV